MPEKTGIARSYRADEAGKTIFEMFKLPADLPKGKEGGI
jgi:hypothetical protein